jgi:hypothetical protein
MIMRKAVQLGLLKMPPKTVKEMVAEGFVVRQQKRDLRRKAQNAKTKAYLEQQRAEQARMANRKTGGRQ